MIAQEAEAIRLTPRRADGLITALDALIVFCGVVVARFVLTHAHAAWVPVPGGAPDAAAISWGLAGIVLAGALMMAFHHLGHYDRRRPFGQEVRDLLIWSVLLAGIDAGIALIAGVPVWMPFVFWGATAALVPVTRAAVRRRLDAVGLWRRPTVVVGTGENGIHAARALMAEPSLGLTVIAFADLGTRAARGPDGSGAVQVDGENLPVVAVERVLAPERASANFPHVVVAPDADEMGPCTAVFERLAGSDCEVDFIPPFGDLALTEARLARFVGSDVGAFRLRDRLSAPLPRAYKRVFDLVVGSALLLGAAPLLGAIAVAILAVDGPPVFFRQRRVGMHGQPFDCLKFRTMVRDADARLAALLESDLAARMEWERDRKLRNDPRISRVGAWLRRTSLDELPQLWNVLRGEMSLIGPRPVVEDELARYGERAAMYLKTRPGLSGLWQVSGRSDVDYRQRVAMDCRYVRNWTPWWDVALLIATLRAVLSRRGAY